MEPSKILVVEDEFLIAQDIVNALCKMGYATCEFVPTGHRALKVVEDKKPDLVLMDIMLKGEMDGIETARIIYDRYWIPVVFLTASTDRSLLDRAKISEPFGYLIKPFSREELRSTIEIALSKSILDRKLRENSQMLEQAQAELEDKVRLRTADLARANDKLQSNIKALEKTQKDLKNSIRERALLSRKLLTAQENERKRIAIEMHDSIGQALNVIHLRIERAVRMLSTTGASPIRMELNTLSPLCKKAIEEVRAIIENLRPPILDDLGLLSTIRWLLREFRKAMPATEFEADVDIDEDEMPEDLKITIYRILQEGLNNIAKHSRAKRVEISLCRMGAAIELKIADDGVGIELTDAQSAEMSSCGYGLAGMRQRSELSGGFMRILSESGRGTTIHIRWNPAQQEAQPTQSCAIEERFSANPSPNSTNRAVS
jgi:signal transduction histidine kinase